MNNSSEIVLLSLKIAVASTLLTTPVGIYLGWLFSRKTFPGKRILDGLVNVPLVLPPVVTGYILIIILGPAGYIGRYLNLWFGLQIAFTWKAAVAAAAIVSLPLLVRAVRVAVDSVDSKLEDAARMLRANEWQIFSSITLPLSLHGVAAGALLAFARALGEFGATIMFASNIPGETQTISLAVFTFLNQPGGEAKVRVLIGISIAISYVSILVNEVLVRKLRAVHSR
ncbi:MAG: molybdate ABC transporter permease subunit [bacterium]